MFDPSDKTDWSFTLSKADIAAAKKYLIDCTKNNNGIGFTEALESYIQKTHAEKMRTMLAGAERCVAVPGLGAMANIRCVSTGKRYFYIFDCLDECK